MYYTPIDLLKCCWDLATLFETQTVKYFTHRFLNIFCSEPQVGGPSFLFGKFKTCIKIYVDFKL